MRPMLVPGTHLLRRGSRHLQTGLTPGRTVVTTAADVPVDGPPVTPEALRAGLALTDDRPLREVLPGHAETDPWRRHGLAALARRHRDDLASALGRRDQHTVELQGFGHPLDERIADELHALLSRAGLRLPGPARPGPGSRLRSTVLGVLAGVGEPHREQVDPWVRTGRPHLLLRWVEGDVLLGPFVVPGSTACLRCVDAHRTEDDPAWPLLVEQYARVTRHDRPDGVPEPVDPTTATLAAAWAVTDLATYAEGGRPTTLGATVRLSPRMERIETTHWRRHPACGCDWG